MFNGLIMPKVSEKPDSSIPEMDEYPVTRVNFQPLVLKFGEYNS